MYQSGISAVADISNTGNTIRTKQKSKIYWHNFVELFGLVPGKASEIWESGLKVEKLFLDAGLRASICPHAPYSISTDLWEKISSRSYEISSVHNQESRDEENLMTLRKGNMMNWFKKSAYDSGVLPPPGKTSLQSYLPVMPGSQKVLFIHNTYSSYPDFTLAESRYGPENVFWVTCPASNLYIENCLPGNLMKFREGRQICIGTDSLGSNSSLSMINEMAILQQNFPSIGFEELLGWSTINGARALGIDEMYGSLSPGKKPGLVLIEGIDFEKMKLNQKSASRRIA